MLPAPLDRARAALVRRGLAAVFSEVYADLDGMRAAVGHPVVAISNHSSVFDGFVAMTACDRVGRSMHLGVRASVLTSHPWSRHLGYFAVSPGDRARTDQMLCSMARLLCEAPTSLV